MDVADHCDGSLLIRSVDNYLVSRGDGEYDAIWQVKEWYFARVCALCKEVWVEFNASGVCLEAWEHKSRLAQSMFQKAIHCVSVAIAPGLNRVTLQLIEAGRWREKEVTIGTPSESSHE